MHDRRGPDRRDDLARDLELLAERLAESREAIVRILAASAGDEVAPDEPPSGPVRLPRVLHSAPDLPGAPAPEDQMGSTGQRPPPDDAAVPDPGRRGVLSAAHRRLLAVVLLAVGAVVLLTSLVTLL
jgi:hypothetical protein